jgi:hypothetical protein
MREGERERRIREREIERESVKSKIHEPVQANKTVLELVFEINDTRNCLKNTHLFYFILCYRSRRNSRYELQDFCNSPIIARAHFTLGKYNFQ